MKLKPLGRNVLMEQQNKKKSLIIVDGPQNKKLVVVAVGKECEVPVGAEVILSHDARVSEINRDKDYLICNEDEIVAYEL